MSNPFEVLRDISFVKEVRERADPYLQWVLRTPKGPLAEILCLVPCDIEGVIVPVKCYQYKGHKGKHRVTQGFAQLQITYEWEQGAYVTKASTAK